MIQLNQSDNPMMYDLSFMFTKRCNLQCSFCMYESGPDIQEELDLTELQIWLNTVNMRKIASFGVYGGEPSIALDGYSRIMDMVSHLEKLHFVITNGSWSTSEVDTVEFLRFCAKYKMHIVVSGTAEHREYQYREVIEWLKKQYPDAFRLKPLEENLHAMGRLKGPVSCSQKCMTWDKALRIAVTPSGEIIYQNCDGVYPVVGDINEPFTILDNRVQDLRKNGFKLCKHYIGETS